MDCDERMIRLSSLRRLYHHVCHGGKLNENDDKRFGFKLTKKSIEQEIIRLEGLNNEQGQVYRKHST